MTKPVPIEAAKACRQQLSEGGRACPGDVSQLVDFALSFEPSPLPGMTVEPVAGELNEIQLVDDSIEADTFDLIRLNGRVYAPEVVEVEQPTTLEGVGIELYPLPSVDEVSNALRWLAPLQADDARRTLLEIAADRLDATCDAVLHVAGNGKVLREAEALSYAHALEGLGEESSEAYDRAKDGAAMIRFLVDRLKAEQLANRMQQFRELEEPGLAIEAVKHAIECGKFDGDDPIVERKHLEALVAFFEPEEAR